ncbi:hypothetical protein BDL97_11G065700 [Sphagnum fallax]|nr:hypothetical protein BDL97_11G065700 [Sphagnum fallax]
MSRGDQGGGCIAMYAGTPTFPSKTQHIMSRYRPIAPKPLAPKPEGTDPSDPQTSSSLSLDKGSSKLSGSKGRRSRKRQTDSSSGSTRNTKKASVAAPEKRLIGTTSKSPATPTSKRNEPGSPKEVAVELTPILSESVAPVFGPGGLQRFNESTDRSGHSVLSLATRSLVNDENGIYGVGENRLVKLALPGDAGLMMEMPLRETATENNDSAFMNRAAESSPVWRRGEGSGSGMSNQRLAGFSGGFGEMFKGLPRAQVTMPDPRMQPLSSLPSRETDCTVMKSNEPQRGTFLPLPYASASYGGESEVCSADDVAESRRTNLVTLSLLPDTPLNGPESPSDSSFPSPLQAKSKSSLQNLSRHGLRFDCNNAASDQVEADTNLTMFSTGEWREEECRDSTTGKKELTSSQKSEDTHSLGPVAARDFVERASGSTHATIHCPAGGDRQGLNVPVVDSYHLDQVYATSSDAVMLTDEQNRILWSNSAFRRAATEKTSGKMQSAGPHIDPLGIPTQLAVVMFQPPYHAPKCTAVLWGFLKKFIFQEAGPCFADSKGLGEWKFSQAQSHGQSYDSRTASFDTSMVPKDSVVYEGDLSLGLSPHKVIAPQPIRAVGSTIFLECITKVNQLASPMLGTVEAFQDQLEKLLLPTVITDLRHRVRWVNTAYKQMVGQPEFAWLSSTVGGNSEPEAPSQTRLAGDVSLVCAGEQPPVDAAEFSCQVRIQWTKGGGENSSLACPVDVIRLDEDSSGPLFVWKFDIFNG